MKKITLDSKLTEVAKAIHLESKRGDDMATRVYNRLFAASSHIKTLKDLKRVGEKGKLYGIKRAFYYSKQGLEEDENKLGKEFMGYSLMLRGFGEKGLNYLNGFLNKHGIESIKNKRH